MWPAASPSRRPLRQGPVIDDHLRRLRPKTPRAADVLFRGRPSRSVPAGAVSGPVCITSTSLKHGIPNPPEGFARCAPPLITTRRYLASSYWGRLLNTLPIQQRPVRRQRTMVSLTHNRETVTANARRLSSWRHDSPRTWRYAQLSHNLSPILWIARQVDTQPSDNARTLSGRVAVS